MDSLFGIPLTSILVGLLALLAGAFAILGWVAWRNPLLVLGVLAVFGGWLGAPAVFHVPSGLFSHQR